MPAYTVQRGRHASGLTAEQRFWPRVIEDGECWLWTGAGHPGYGRFQPVSGEHRSVQAHRYTYELIVAEIPADLVLDHLCRVRSCVNPFHLEPVPNVENVLRGISPHALNASKTHCIRGHEFNEANTYINSRGGRVCRPCGAAKVAAYRSRRASS